MDKEPERYYDWMLWKMRQEDKSNQDNLEDKLEDYGQTIR